MKLVNQYLNFKNNYKGTLILIHSGNFFYTFSEDAIIMNYLFDYKIVENKVGFPFSIIEKIKNKLNYLKIDYLIIKKCDYYYTTFKSYNNYSNINTEAKKASIKKDMLELLLKEINDKVEVDAHNFQLIWDYVNEL